LSISNRNGMYLFNILRVARGRQAQAGIVTWLILDLPRGFNRVEMESGKSIQDSGALLEVSLAVHHQVFAIEHQAFTVCQFLVFLFQY